MLLVHHVCRRRARCHANTGASRHEITWTQAVRRRAGRSFYPRRQRESHLTSQRYLPHYSASCGRASAQSPCTETTGSPLRTAPFGKPRGRLPAAKISAKPKLLDLEYANPYHYLPKHRPKQEDVLAT